MPSFRDEQFFLSCRCCVLLQEKRRKQNRKQGVKRFGLEAALNNPEKYCKDREKELQRHKDAYQRRRNDPVELQKLQQRKKDYNMKNRRGNLSEEKREEERRKARERHARQMAAMSPEERRKKERLKYERRKEKKRAAREATATSITHSSSDGQLPNTEEDSLSDNPLVDYFGAPYDVPEF